MSIKIYALKRSEKFKFRGISHEQACVLIAMDRNGHLISRNTSMALISTTRIDDVIGAYISPKSLLCSDSAKNYETFEKSKVLEHKQVLYRHRYQSKVNNIQYYLPYSNYLYTINMVTDFFIVYSIVYYLD